jgi:hypothetical protein
MEGALDLNKTTITVASATYAAKTQRLLSRNGIPSKLVKMNDSTKNGCAYGLLISSLQLFEAIVILKENGIPYSVHNT